MVEREPVKVAEKESVWPKIDVSQAADAIAAMAEPPNAGRESMPFFARGGDLLSMGAKVHHSISNRRAPDLNAGSHRFATPV